MFGWNGLKKELFSVKQHRDDLKEKLYNMERYAESLRKKLKEEGFYKKMWDAVEIDPDITISDDEQRRKDLIEKIIDKYGSPDVVDLKRWLFSENQKAKKENDSTKEEYEDAIAMSKSLLILLERGRKERKRLQEAMDNNLYGGLPPGSILPSKVAN